MARAHKFDLIVEAGAILKELSQGDKSSRLKEDSSLPRLLDLDGEIMEIGGGYWVEIRARRVPPTSDKPHGIDYSLSLLHPDRKRLVGYDNAHPVSSGRPPSRKRAAASDHRHERASSKPYAYADAEKLLQDFWADVERILKEEGIP